MPFSELINIGTHAIHADFATCVFADLWVGLQMMMMVMICTEVQIFTGEPFSGREQCGCL